MNEFNNLVQHSLIPKYYSFSNVHFIQNPKILSGLPVKWFSVVLLLYMLFVESVLKFSHTISNMKLCYRRTLLWYPLTCNAFRYTQRGFSRHADMSRYSVSCANLLKRQLTWDNSVYLNLNTAKYCAPRTESIWKRNRTASNVKESSFNSTIMLCNTRVFEAEAIKTSPDFTSQKLSFDWLYAQRVSMRMFRRRVVFSANCEVHTGCLC